MDVVIREVDGVIRAEIGVSRAVTILFTFFFFFFLGEIRKKENFVLFGEISVVTGTITWHNLCARL